MLLGAGRKTKEDKIDFSAGITLIKKVGDKVNTDDTICVLHTNIDDTRESEDMIRNAYSFSDVQVNPPKHIYDVIV